MRITAILCVKNEGAFVLDWLAHHRAAGITDFLVCSNDCSDGTDALLDRLAARGLVHHMRNPGPFDHRGVQFTALNRAAAEPVVQRADWLLPLDIDEFVAVRLPGHDLPALLAALPGATAISLTWRLFGNDGVLRYSDRPVTEQFTRAAPRVIYWPWRGAMFKTLYRNDGTYRVPGVHRPRRPDPARLDDARWYDGSGRPLPARFHRGRLFSDYGRDNHALVQLNHYPLGAMDSFLLKVDRGRAVHSGQAMGMDYWVERNFCAEEDDTIAPLAAPAAAIRAGLAADPETGRLHDAAVAWRHERVQKLLKHEPYRALLGRLMMTPPSRPLPPEMARVVLDHAHRAVAR